MRDPFYGRLKPFSPLHKPMAIAFDRKKDKAKCIRVCSKVINGSVDLAHIASFGAIVLALYTKLCDRTIQQNGNLKAFDR